MAMNKGLLGTPGGMNKGPAGTLVTATGMNKGPGGKSVPATGMNKGPVLPAKKPAASSSKTGPNYMPSLPGGTKDYSASDSAMRSAMNAPAKPKAKKAAPKAKAQVKAPADPADTQVNYQEYTSPGIQELPTVNDPDVYPPSGMSKHAYSVQWK